MPPHVFISYSRQDQPYAHELADDLRADGVEVWLDDRVDFGDRWWRTIVKAIHACAAFVVVMTPEAEESEWVEREILLAQREGKPLFPLLLRGKGHSLLITTQHADVTGSRMPPKAFYDRLRRTLPAPKPVAEPPVEHPSETSRAEPRGETPAKERRTKASAVKPLHVNFEPEPVYIPAGPFLMGSNEGRKDEYPQHTVELSAYWIGKYPVTNVEYQAFVRDARHRPPKGWDGDAYPDGIGNHPVVHVSWYNAVAYCKWLGEKTGKEYRLPTEAQWEKAARGEDGRKYPWGDQWDAWRLNSLEGSRVGTSPVGQFSPKGDSPYSVADMAGNVFEWCADWYDKAEYERRADGVVVDPEGPPKGTSRVLRGGSFFLNVNFVHCAVRYGIGPGHGDAYGGFRILFLP